MRVYDMFLAAGMLASGTINTIASKLQDSIHSVGLPGSSSRPFAHPAVQTLTMFMGESLCMIVFLATVWRARRNRKYTAVPTDETDKPARSYPFWLFALPAMCDMTGSTMMYIGLLMTYPSVYQMLRGMIVVFTALFSFLFLGRKLKWYHVLGMFLIIIGTFMVGLASVIGKHEKDKASDPVLGDILVVGAQLVAATQMVLEEKFIGKYNVAPLQVVGNEGLWGGFVTSILLVAAYFIKPIRDHDNSLDAMYQIANSYKLLLALILSIVSIAFLNFCGISVTKYLSATHRTTIDATRVVLVWAVSLVVGWESFQVLQLFGFIVLILGTAIFNEIIKIPGVVYPTAGQSEHTQVPQPINEEKKLLS